MTKPLFLSGLFLVVFLISVIAAVPLSFVLQKTEARQAGMSWTDVSGTVFKGSISGARFGVQPIGRIDLRLQTGSLLQGNIAYNVAWNGVPGSGTADLALGRDRVSVTDLNALIEIKELVGLANDIRRVGGVARVSAGAVRFNEGRCEEASGQVSTDALARAAAEYGQSATDLSGVLECDGPMLRIPVRGEVSVAGALQADLRVGLVEPSSLEARIETLNPELATLLVLQGFEPSGDVYLYRREAQLGVR